MRTNGPGETLGRIAAAILAAVIISSLAIASGGAAIAQDCTPGEEACGALGVEYYAEGCSWRDPRPMVCDLIEHLYESYGCNFGEPIEDFDPWEEPYRSWAECGICAKIEQFCDPVTGSALDCLKWRSIATDLQIDCLDDSTRTLGLTFGLAFWDQ